MDTDLIIVESFIQNHSTDAEQIISEFDTDEILRLLKILSTETTSVLLTKMDRFRAADCIKKADLETAIQLIEPLDPLSTALIFRHLSGKYETSILEGLSSGKANSIKQILNYNENTVGAYHDPNIFTLYDDMSIHQALNEVKMNYQWVKSPIFVLSRDQRLVGYLDIKQLIINDPAHLIISVMNTDPPKIKADIDIRTFTESRGWDESFSFMPVVSNSGIFLGVLYKQILSEDKIEEKFSERQARQTSIALGDLYQIGFGSIVQSLSDILWEIKSK
jgi:magnesium transporter